MRITFATLALKDLKSALLALERIPTERYMRVISEIKKAIPALETEHMTDKADLGG